MDKIQRNATIRELAFRAGFDLAAFTGPSVGERESKALSEWIDKGRAGTMDYMKRSPERRSDARLSLASCRSVIVLAVNYYHPEDPKPSSDTPLGKVSKYAYGRDYHAIIEKMLKRLSAMIREEVDAAAELKAYVDTGPILERAFARQAGLGFIGKNTNLITREYGSWVFLSCLLTDLELEPDKPHEGACGTCRICIDACPTGALDGAHGLDATRCISYWSIEAKEPPPADLRARFGEWIFGCDICQDVCPYNFRAKTTRQVQLYPEKRAGTWIDPAALPSGAFPGPLKRAKLIPK